MVSGSDTGRMNPWLRVLAVFGAAIAAALLLKVLPPLIILVFFVGGIAAVNTLTVHESSGPAIVGAKSAFAPARRSAGVTGPAGVAKLRVDGTPIASMISRK